MPLLGITLQVTPIRLDNSFGVAHIPTSLYDDYDFSLLQGREIPEQQCS
jgi:hypothetical protein